MATLEAPVARSADVFVSYSRDDETRVLDVAAKLRAAGVSLWIDQGGLDGASQWSEQIVNALESAKVLLLMVTEAAFQRVIELKPAFISGYADMAMTCDGLGRQSEARAARDQMLERLPNYILQNPDDSRARMFYAVTLAESGRKDEAIRGGSSAIEISPDDSMMLYNCACLHARLGEPQRALDLLRQAIARGHLNFGWMRNDPDMLSLRDNPEFIALTSGQTATDAPG
jgi:tetratricopeptide (TPR) repeat protein